MTDEELAAIRARCEASTKGPWHWHGTSTKDYPNQNLCRSIDVIPDDEEDYQRVIICLSAGTVRDNAGVAVNLSLSMDGCPLPHDAAFIAHAREDVPALLAEVERLRALNEGLAERVARQSELLSRRAERN